MYPSFGSSPILAWSMAASARAIIACVEPMVSRSFFACADRGFSRLAELGTSTAPARGALVAASTNWPSFVLSAGPMVPSAFFTVTGVNWAGLVWATTFGLVGAGAGGGLAAAATPVRGAPGAGGGPPAAGAVAPWAATVGAEEPS